MKIRYSITNNDSPTVQIIGSEIQSQSDLPVGDYLLSGTVTNEEGGWSQTFSQNIAVTNTGDPNRFMFFGGARTSELSGTLTTISAGAEYTTTVVMIPGPKRGGREFLFHLSGSAATESGSSPQETIVTGNLINVDRLQLRYGGLKYVCDINGSTSVVITSGSKGVLARLILPFDLPPETTMQMELTTHGSVGDKRLPGYRIQRERGERIYGASSLSAVDALADGGSDSTYSLDTGFSATMPSYYAPSLCFVKGWELDPVPLLVGDSIGKERQEYSASASPRGAMGWIRRWLDIDDPTYGRIDFGCLAVPGANSTRTLATNATKIWDIIDDVTALSGGVNKWPFTSVIDQLGRNDSGTYTAMWASYTGLLNRIKARYPGVKIVCCTILPRTTSTDQWTTRSGQSPSDANNTYPTGGVYQLNDAIRMNNGNIHNGYLDPYAAVHDDTYPGTWPESLFTTTLTAQAGTDGVTPWNTTEFAERPEIGSILSAGSVAITVGTVEGSGPFTVTDETPQAAIVALGTVAKSRSAADSLGVHPGVEVINLIANNVPQSGKALLI